MTSMITVRPMVLKRDGRKRQGKGFSQEELKKTGLSLREALKLGIPVDCRRKTIHKENVNIIKSLLKSRKKTSKSKKRRKTKS